MKLSVIIPCYNEAKDISAKAKEVLNKLKTLNIDTELILVNDGSKDNTKEVINSIEGVIPSGYDVNKGKGGAVQKGIQDATGDYILFMDADLSTDLEALDRLVPILDQYDIIIGSRHHKDSKIPIKQPAKRRFIGWCCRKIVNAKFHMKYSDTQCGFKAMRTKIAKQIAKKQIIMGFAFDVEYLYIAKLNNFIVHEMGITWRDDRGSTVSPIKSSIKFFKDLKVIKKNKENYLI
ncbi:MAG: glycosyltransferase [Bacilli bacterium]|nr:glycosyltransferase [Bacilli bacterium]MBR0033958.1 glycosyltransferase [Bacilli bacterium]MBR0194410.1 glycosyltransferase [Bacilli bacterium]